MSARKRDTNIFDQGASRRQFFKLLAESPLLGLAATGLPTSWQTALAREAERRAATPAPSSLRCRGCGIEMPLAPNSESHVNLGQAPEGQMRDAINEQFTGQMIESVDDAVNVWDFERVAYANNLAQHWDYLHMGVDDFETRRANREGFNRLIIRPRRLGPDATNLDMSVNLFGKEYASPLFLCPVASLEAYHTEGEAGAARAAGAHGILQMQSHQSSQSYDEIAEARGEPHWFQIYTASDFNVNKRVIER
ncbi:MAG TPA: hypothetical protein EYO94_13690, partial [Acidobacteria bacterium]|nr:hypothetical protein [Acidobacteriota bacterium]